MDPRTQLRSYPVPMVDHGEERKEALRRYEAGGSPAVDIVECQMLDDRKTAILSAVVHEYIATAQPVGSSHLVDAPEWVSLPQQFEMSLPIRARGFLYNRTRQPVESQPIRDTDTSSTTSQRPALDLAQTAQIGDFFTAAHGRLEEMLHQTSDLLANLTNSAFSGGSDTGRGEVRSVQLVPLIPPTQQWWSCFQMGRWRVQRSNFLMAAMMNGSLMHQRFSPTIWWGRNSQRLRRSTASRTLRLRLWQP